MVLRNFSRVAAAVVIAPDACAGVDAAIHFSKQTVAVVTPDSTLHSGSFDEAQSSFTVHNGANLSMIDYRDNWLQVADCSGEIGRPQRG